MKTVILIISPTSKAGEIEDIKDKIIKYLGSRMIEQVPDDVPGLVLNCLLDSTDKNAIVNVVTSRDDRSCVLFLETEKETLPSNDYYVFEI
jgi:hypothetical protein